jgi:hypothetical protein
LSLVNVRPSILLLVVIVLHALAAMCSFMTVAPVDSVGDAIGNAVFVIVLLVACAASLWAYTNRFRSQLHFVVVPGCIVIYLLLISSLVRWLGVI